MDWRQAKADIEVRASQVWRQLGPNRRWIASGAGVLALVMVLGLWSCQTTPVPRRPPIPGSAATMTTGEPEVRVRIRQSLQSVKLEGPSQFVVRPIEGSGVAVERVGVERRLPGPLTASVHQDGVRVTDGRGAHWGYVTPIEIVAAEAPVPRGDQPPSQAVALIKVEGAQGQGVQYSGRLRIVPRPATSSRSASAEGSGGSSDARPARLDVIEVVPMETYIAGVTVSELWGHWALAAFQAQSVAARTYAMQQRQRAAQMQRDFDLEATVVDQAYNGWTAHANANQAAAETRGVVLTWQGRLLRAYYSSTCGGRTAGAAEVWPTGPGFEFNLDGPIQSYEREHACQPSTSYTWEVNRERAELSTRMREWGKTNGNNIRRIGQVQTIAVIERNSTGRPVRYVVTDDQGRRYELGAEHLRNACNYGVPGLPEITMKNRVRSGDLEMELGGSQVVLRGRGFGHGVGMCQFCAQGMAQRGDHWRVMLNRFYPGARLERVY